MSSAKILGGGGGGVYIHYKEEQAILGDHSIGRAKLPSRVYFSPPEINPGR